MSELFTNSPFRLNEYNALPDRPHILFNPVNKQFLRCLRDFRPLGYEVMQYDIQYIRRLQHELEYDHNIPIAPHSFALGMGHDMQNTLFAVVESVGNPTRINDEDPLPPEQHPAAQNLCFRLENYLCTKLVRRQPFFRDIFRSCQFSYDPNLQTFALVDIDPAIEPVRPTALQEGIKRFTELNLFARSVMDSPEAQAKWESARTHTWTALQSEYTYKELDHAIAANNLDNSAS